MFFKTAATAITLALMLQGTPARAGGGELDAGQIANLFPGQYEARIRGYKVKFAGDSSGRLVGQAFGREDRGTWFVLGDSLCVSWRQWTKGQSTCGSIARQDGWLVASNDSGEMLRFKASRLSSGSGSSKTHGGSFDRTR